MALKVMHEEPKPLELKISWSKTKIQSFIGLICDTVQFVHACAEDVHVTRSSTHLGSAVHNSRKSDSRLCWTSVFRTRS